MQDSGENIYYNVRNYGSTNQSVPLSGLNDGAKKSTKKFANWKVILAICTGTLFLFLVLLQQNPNPVHPTANPAKNHQKPTDLARNHPISPSTFPNNFIWGTSTAAYQVEGAAREDGRGLSIWDVFSHESDKIYHSQNGDVADDQYHKYSEDILQMKKLGFQNYRLSISPTRILPKGKGEVNQAGIDHYNKVFNELTENGITPFVTLYHWDLPQDLDTEYGGWLDTRSINDFVQYADICFKNFGDRVKYWFTFNEPWTFAWLGYGTGYHAPGRCTNRGFCKAGNSSIEPYIVGHNVLLTHANVVKLYREKYADQNGKISIVLNCDWSEPLTQTPDDVSAAQRRVEFQLGWFADPIYFGDYPASMKKAAKGRLPVFTDEEKQLLKGSVDFFALNHYSTSYAFYSKPTSEDWAGDQFAGTTVVSTTGKLIGPRADSDWLYVVPWGMGKLLDYVYNRYKNPPLYITENGCDVPNESELELQEALNDTFRIDFYKGYLEHVLKAIERGVDVKGYFAWSFMDNFEWCDGYHKRFGLHYVDYENGLTRYPKASALWFQKVIYENRLVS